MTEEQKAQLYGSLLNEHTKYFNEINRNKADKLELNREQRFKIQELENRQKEIIEKIKRLFN
jgi:hypothetical protein